MGFIEARCKNCGGDIRLDENLARGKCEYCGTEFVKSDVIVNNNYNIKNATLVIDDDKMTEQMFTNAETYLSTLKDYDRAFSAYQAITQSKANDHRGWWGSLRATSQDFTLIAVEQQDYEKMCYYANNAIKLVPEQEKATLTKQWEEYKQKVEEYISSKDQAFAEWIERVEARQKRMERNRIISRFLINAISIAINLFIILYGLFRFDSFGLDQAAPVFIYVGVSLAVNTIITIIFQLACHAPETCIYQIITTIAVAVYFCYRLTAGNMYVASLLDLIIFAVFGIAVAAICILPTALVARHILRKKRSA